MFARRGALAGLALAASACGLVKINGKPLQLGNSAQASGARTSQESSVGEEPEQAAAVREGGPPATALTAAWCERRSGESGEVAGLERELAEKSLDNAARALLREVCASQGEAVERPERLTAVAKAWMAKHHFDERDVLALVARGGDVQDFATFPGPVGEYGKFVGYPIERMAVLDRLGARSSTLARVALVRQCFELSLNPYEPQKPAPILLAILCTRLPVDLRQAEVEIEEGKELSDASRFKLRRESFLASEAMRVVGAQLAEAAQDDPGVARLIEIADKEVKSWTAPSAKRSKAVALLAKMEAAAESKKRSAFAGCQEETVAAWTEALAGRKLPEVPEQNQLAVYVNAALSTAEGYLTYSALRLCSAAHETPATETPSNLFAEHKVRRGPLSGTIAAWMAQDERIEFDVRDRSLASLFQELGVWSGNTYQPRVRAGVIARISEIKGGVEVTFKQVREPRVTCMRWVPTNRIAAIEAGGQVRYEERCAVMGKAMMDLTAEPVRFGKAMSQGLSPGMFLTAIDGLPIAATSSAASGKPLFVLGALLK